MALRLISASRAARMSDWQQFDRYERKLPQINTESIFLFGLPLNRFGIHRFQVLIFEAQ